MFVLGNTLVLITIFRFMKRESVTNICIANLSFGDILVVGFALPFMVSDILTYVYFNSLLIICILWHMFCFA